jgi:hypothetical protein
VGTAIDRSKRGRDSLICAGWFEQRCPIDHATDVSFAAALCPADGAQPPDGVVDSNDLSVMLEAWDGGPGPFDVNDDDMVDVLDLVAILAAFGPCH